MPTLRVSLIRASDLVVSDSLLEGNKSDPYVVFKVGRETLQSSCIPNTLNPEWVPHETFDFLVVEPGKDVLQIHVFDYDRYNAPDLIGTLALPVSKYMDALDLPQNEIFFLDVPSYYSSQNCKSTIELEICLSAEESDTITLRMWENEVWSLSSGWVPSNTEIYRRWSAYDDAETSNRFEQVAPKIPHGTDPQGWGYVEQNRGSEGWMYAYNFLGPFATTKSLVTCVRRRLWENRCIRKDKTKRVLYF
ncbi:hypothetical protein Poli38472_008670 [Pythium oligandrum]|uniref:C2 domain-containing protein n=1 Tax=Pythium oligandrum TaxID=41045 RepID=A0A8K1C4L3_PYTOL|nr:hypothetical protein Poli38472_008670 [Pythium oligandrum]|eukprot:TMW56022.1 hypothetical protein Poli38472_008670 [Pythium oligandrum]